MEMKIGDRIIDEYLGRGEIVKIFGNSYSRLYLVMFDETPPYKYNMGDNPTIVFEKTFKKELI
jgi:hypothetical protein